MKVRSDISTYCEYVNPGALSSRSVRVSRLAPEPSALEANNAAALTGGETAEIARRSGQASDPCKKNHQLQERSYMIALGSQTKLGLDLFAFLCLHCYPFQLTFQAHFLVSSPATPLSDTSKQS